MSDVSVSLSTVGSETAKIIAAIQADIIDATETSRITILDSIENSAGDFIESLKTEVIREAATITSVGKLLIEMLNYVQAAANCFAYIDYSYSGSHIDK